jgi:hypothetical protein
MTLYPQFVGEWQQVLAAITAYPMNDTLEEARAWPRLAPPSLSGILVTETWRDHRVADKTTVTMVSRLCIIHGDDRILSCIIGDEAVPRTIIDAISGMITMCDFVPRRETYTISLHGYSCMDV